MAGSKSSDNDDLVYGLMIAGLFILVAAPALVIMSAKAVPDKVMSIPTRKILLQSGLIALVGLAYGLVAYLYPIHFEGELFRIGGFVVRVRYVSHWFVANAEMFAVVYGTMPYWRKFLPVKKTDLRSALF